MNRILLGITLSAVFVVSACANELGSPPTSQEPTSTQKELEPVPTSVDPEPVTDPDPLPEYDIVAEIERVRAGGSWADESLLSDVSVEEATAWAYRSGFEVVVVVGVNEVVPAEGGPGTRLIIRADGDRVVGAWAIDNS